MCKAVSLVAAGGTYYSVGVKHLEYKQTPAHIVWCDLQVERMEWPVSSVYHCFFEEFSSLR